MPDLEKVIEGLRHCTAWAGLHECQPKIGPDCPYEDDADCKLALMRDALTLLKEQEPIPCGEKIKAGDVVLDFYKCGYCKNAIRTPWKYCPFCGKEVKWDGFD